MVKRDRIRASTESELKKKSREKESSPSFPPLYVDGVKKTEETSRKQEAPTVSSLGNTEASWTEIPIGEVEKEALKPSPPWEETPAIKKRLLEAAEKFWRSQVVRVRNRSIEAGEWAKRKRIAIKECGRRATLVIRDCGHRQAIVHRCHSPLCPSCHKIDFWTRVWAYLPDLERKVREEDMEVRFFTLTAPTVRKEELLFRVYRLRKAFSLFKDIRLGPRAMARWERMFYEALGRSKLSQGQRACQIRLFKEFKMRVEAWHKRLGTRSLRLRDISAGLAVLEVKYQGEGIFHPHWHVLLVTDFPLPQVLLAIWWTKIFRGRGVDIGVDLLNVHIETATGDPRRVAVYITKYTPGDKMEDLSPEDEEAFLYALRYTRRLNTWGLKRKERPKVCSACGSATCRVAKVVTHEVELEESFSVLEERTKWCFLVRDPETRRELWRGEILLTERGLEWRGPLWLAWSLIGKGLPNVTRYYFKKRASYVSPFIPSFKRIL